MSTRVEITSPQHLTVAGSNGVAHSNGRLKGALNSPPQNKPQTVVQADDIFQTIKKYLAPVISLLKDALGINGFDNSRYEVHKKELAGLTHPGADERTVIIARAKHRYLKSQEVLDKAKENIIAHKLPHEGLTLSDGVPMSGMLKFLGGDDIAYEVLQHNISINLEAEAQLKRAGLLEDVGGLPVVNEIVKYFDGDNTSICKTIDPGDTSALQSRQKMRWLKVLIETAKPLGIHLTLNTARTGVVSNQTALVPESATISKTRGALPGGLTELGPGVIAQSQFEHSDDLSIIGLNGTIIDSPDSKTLLDRVLIETVLTNQILGMPGAPTITIDGEDKNLLEALKHVATKHNIGIFEPKALPRYLFDSELSLGKTSARHYNKIMALKEEHVNDYLEALKHSGQEITEEHKKQAWIKFGQAVEKSIDDGFDPEHNKNRIWLPGEEGEAGNRNKSSVYYEILKKTYPGLNISSSRYIGCVNYKELLERDPEAFYKQIIQGVSVAFVFHFFDNFGSPNAEVVKDLDKIAKAVNLSPEFRRFLAAESSARKEAFGSAVVRKTVDKFVEEGRSIREEQGDTAYLEYRICEFLMCDLRKTDLENLKTKTGVAIFDCTGKDKYGKDTLKFSDEFHKEVANSLKLVDSPTVYDYLHELKSHFSSNYQDENISSLAPVFDTFLPVEHLNDDINWEIAFQPSSFYIMNSKRAYDGSPYFCARTTVVDKADQKNSLGQYYREYQPNSEKLNAMISFREALTEGKFVTGDGDSTSDLCMMGVALELGGYANTVFTQVYDRDIFEEIISQRLNYYKVFNGDDELYQQCRKTLGIYALESVDKENYKKVVKFNTDGTAAEYEKDSHDKIKLFSKKAVMDELYHKYILRIVHHNNSDAYIRRRAEGVGDSTGVNFEFTDEELTTASNLFKSKQSGKKLSPEQEKLVWRYEESIMHDHFPNGSPQNNVFIEYQGRDRQGDFVVYKSKTNNRQLVISRLNGEDPSLFTGNLSELNLTRVVISQNNQGKLSYTGPDGEEKEYTEVSRLNDYCSEHAVLPESSEPNGLFSNKILKSILGEKILKKLITNIPQLFPKFLRFSGLFLGLGGAIRLLSFGNENIFNFGYKLSNGVRGFSAFGGLLVGLLQKIRLWNIVGGEALGIIASRLPDGAKHAVLGLSNLFLFIGRAQKAAIRGQRINNHAVEVLNTNPKEAGFGEVLKKYVDPRPYVRNITKVTASLITKVKDEIQKAGVSGLLGEISGSLVSAVVAPIKMLKDIYQDPRLITQITERRSEKSGGVYKLVPSTSHLLGFVGVISGLGALAVGIGKILPFGKSDSGATSWLSRIGTSIACGFPGLGIIANANELMANIDGLPKIYKGLNGKDQTFNPKAIQLEKVAGYGFLFTSLFNLSNKYVAAVYDIFNWLYFAGAAVEEGPNSHRTFLSELRGSNQLYQHHDEHHTQYTEAA